jgi:hypothetical protein
MNPWKTERQKNIKTKGQKDRKITFRMNPWKPFIQELLSMFLFLLARQFFQQVTKNLFPNRGTERDRDIYGQRGSETEKQRRDRQRGSETKRQRDSNRAFISGHKEKVAETQKDRKTERQKGRLMRDVIIQYL